MSEKTKKLEKFFWFYLILNPILDIVSGLYIQFITGGNIYNTSTNLPVTPSLIIRMVVLLVMAAYIIMIKDKKAIIAGGVMCLAWALSMVSEYRVISQYDYLFFNTSTFFIDVQYFAKFAYNIAVFFVYCSLLKRSNLSKEEKIEKINKYIMLSLFLLTVVIVIPYIFGAGHYTYVDAYGYRGFRGFYYSGNDIIGALMILFPIGACYYLSMSQKIMDIKTHIFCCLTLSMTVLSMLMIGTKTSFIVIVITVASTGIYSVIRLVKKDKNTIVRFVSAILIFVILYALISGLATAIKGYGMQETLEVTVTGFETITTEQSTEALLFSGRINKLLLALYYYRHGDLFTWLFGVGRGSQLETIEMDVFEVVLYYGVFGAIAMLWLYVKEGFTFVYRFVRRFNIIGFGAFLSLGMCVGYFIVAGHVLFTVTSGFYFTVILAYAKFITSRD